MDRAWQPGGIKASGEMSCLPGVGRCRMELKASAVPDSMIARDVSVMKNVFHSNYKTARKPSRRYAGAFDILSRGRLRVERRQRGAGQYGPGGPIRYETSVFGCLAKICENSPVSPRCSISPRPLRCRAPLCPRRVSSREHVTGEIRRGFFQFSAQRETAYCARAISGIPIASIKFGSSSFKPGILRGPGESGCIVQKQYP